MAHTRQSRPDSGLGVQTKVPKTFKVVPFRVEGLWLKGQDSAPLGGSRGGSGTGPSIFLVNSPGAGFRVWGVQGYLAHKKQPNPPGTTIGP